MGAPEPLGDADATRRPCRRCRGEGRAPGPPILTPNLVIAARPRNRDPELPAATVEHALTAAMPAEGARYDLVVALPDPENVPALCSVALEFARHEHRVFWLSPAADAGRAYVGPTPPLLEQVPLAASGFGFDLERALAALRNDRSVETALLLLPEGGEQSVAEACRRRWGWRSAVVTRADDGGLPTVLLRAEGGAGDGLPPPPVDLRAEASWPARWGMLDRAFRAAWPRATVVVVTIDNLAFTKLCLASVIANTAYPNLEILVVDNGSTDGTPDFLVELARRHRPLRTILNRDNRGFGPANNQALAAATGDLFVLLNNDTMVAPGWLCRLALRLDDPALGLVGPATNRTCNEAQVDSTYQTYEEFLRFAGERVRAHDGQVRPIRMLAMFCTAFRRSLYDEIGPLDERYAVGMFEDEDYALAAKSLGYAVAWAPDVYVHHAYHASIGKLLPAGTYLPLFRTNQQKFEHKWGICWERHRPPA